MAEVTFVLFLSRFFLMHLSDLIGIWATCLELRPVSHILCDERVRGEDGRLACVLWAQKINLWYCSLWTLDKEHIHSFIPPVKAKA